MDPVHSDRARRSRAERSHPRVTDRVEDVVAWLLVSVSLVLLVGSWMFGLAVQKGMEELVGAQSLDRVEVVAVLLETAPSLVGGSGGVGPPAGAVASWIGVDSQPHTGRVDAVSGSPVGTEVPVWIDHDGMLTTPPTTAADAWVDGVLAGFDVLLLGLAVLVGVWMGVRRLTAAVNADEWEQEWAQVEPGWSGRVR